jgi:RNA polymerase sigma-70 factor (ECF subfamily)
LVDRCFDSGVWARHDVGDCCGFDLFSGTKTLRWASNFPASVMTDDQTLITECLAGRKAAFGELVSRHQDRLFNTLLRFLGNAEDARDVLQEALLNAYLALEKFKGDSQLYTWLYRIAMNTAMTHKRKERVALSKRVSRADAAEEPADQSAYNRPESNMLRTEEGERLQNALGKLSPEHRLVLILKDMDGQKYEAMAEALDVPIGTVRSRLHRARLELRELLEGDEDI